ncbi:hypothetical protein SDC9_185716 [bioreactor metagenome]|uniref:Uncharacterized protein n=1 Tax=bioreactor metagenome TaxID=1076179 RepID=A0A645HIG1_9ZZZZ
MDAQGKQRLSGHIHKIPGQFAPLDHHGEGVGQLHAEGKSAFVGFLLQPFNQHGRVGELQVGLKMPPVECHGFIAQRVQQGPHRLIPQQRGVQFDIGMQFLDRNKMPRNPLDLLRRASVQRGQRNGRRNPAAYALHIRLVYVFKQVETG